MSYCLQGSSVQLMSEELLLGSFLGMWVLTLKRTIVLSNLWVLKVPQKLIFIGKFFAGSVLGYLCAVNLTLLNFCYVNKGRIHPKPSDRSKISC
jgi:hypothetical protein